MFSFTYGSKKFFPTPGVFYYMCVGLVNVVHMHMGSERTLGIRISEFLIRAGIFRHCIYYVTLIVDLGMRRRLRILTTDGSNAIVLIKVCISSSPLAACIATDICNAPFSSRNFTIFL
jgi:hypothetical protein